MTLTDIAQIRLKNQCLSAETRLESPKEVLGQMGAMQAQHFEMSKYAIAVRLQDATKSTIETAMDDGEILRTHLLRPTWHLVAKDDIRWMMELSGPNIQKAAKTMNKQMGLDEVIFKKSEKIIRKCLEGGNELTRKELMAALEKEGIKTNEYRASLFMFRAETDMFVCSGAQRKKQTTYALFDEKVPPAASIPKEEALAKLISIYLNSHGPATLKDFTWWSGLSVADAKKALESVKSDFISENIGTETYWFSPFISYAATKKSPIQLLPAFDEFIISYSDRSAAVEKAHQTKAFSTKNGYFNPLILSGAQVIGTWKPGGTGKNAGPICSFFCNFNSRLQAELDLAIQHFKNF